MTVRLSKNKAVHDGIQDDAQSILWSFLATRQREAISYRTHPHLFAVAVKAQERAASKLTGLPSSPYKHRLVATSRLHEPPDATADSVVCTRIPVTQATSQLPSSSVGSKPPSWSTLLRKYVPGLKYTCKGAKSDKHLDCRVCLSVTEHPPASTMLMASSMQSMAYSATELWAPFLFAEYKRNYDEISKAFHQCQLYVISTVDYLAALGIRDFPIFGIVAAGAQVSVMMAWRCSERLNLSGVNKEEVSMSLYSILFVLLFILSYLSQNSRMHVKISILLLMKTLFRSILQSPWTAIALQ